MATASGRSTSATMPWSSARGRSTARPSPAAGRSMGDLRRIGRPSPFRALAILGHSASGKSSVVARLGLRRQECDYDVVIRDCAGDYEAAIRILARPENGLIILPNNRKIIPKIRKDLLAEDNEIGFIYLKRPEEVVRKNLG